MASQGERVLGVLEIDLEMRESMAQEGVCLDVESMMQGKPIPEGWEKRQYRSSGWFCYFNPLTNHWQWRHPGQQTVQQSRDEMKQLMEMIKGMNDEMKIMNNKMDAHTK